MQYNIKRNVKDQYLLECSVMLKQAEAPEELVYTSEVGFDGKCNPPDFRDIRLNHDAFASLDRSPIEVAKFNPKGLAVPAATTIAGLSAGYALSKKDPTTGKKKNLLRNLFFGGSTGLLSGILGKNIALGIAGERKKLLESRERYRMREDLERQVSEYNSSATSTVIGNSIRRPVKEKSFKTPYDSATIASLQRIARISPYILPTSTLYTNPSGVVLPAAGALAGMALAPRLLPTADTDPLNKRNRYRKAFKTLGMGALGALTGMAGKGVLRPILNEAVRRPYDTPFIDNSLRPLVSPRLFAADGIPTWYGE